MAQPVEDPQFLHPVKYNATENHVWIYKKKMQQKRLIFASWLALGFVANDQRAISAIFGEKVQLFHSTVLPLEHLSTIIQ